MTLLSEICRLGRVGSNGDGGDGTKPYKGKSNIDIEDTQHPEFDSQYSPFSGSVRQGFTSIRAASLRASGLSARRKSLKGVESEDASNQSCDGTIDQSDMGETSERLKGLNCDSNTKHGRSTTARKLLLDDINIAEDEHKDIANDGARGEDLGQVHSYANESAGLSYVNSQEPGDLSQANALDFVDQFLKDNVCDFDIGARRLHAACENQNPILSAKGTQKLAKRNNICCSHAKRGAYDWNNSLEDEGGGEILTRNKDTAVQCF